MRFKLLAFLCLIAAAQRSFVSPAPTDGLERSLGLLHNNGEGRHFEQSPGTHQFDTVHEPAASLDEEVNELERLKPALQQNQIHGQNSGLIPSIGESVSMMKSHSSIFSNVNGKQQGKSETKQELNKNGETFAKIQQKIESKNFDNSGAPDTNIITSVDIPGRGIHKVYRQHHPENSNIFGVLNIPERVEQASKRNMDYRLMEQQQSVPMRDSSANLNNVQASPKDLAEYVFWTGDEKSVTSAIEDYMQAGLMSREEAITLLEDIKLYLGDIQDHYEHEKLKHQLHFSRSNEIPQAGLGSFQLANLKRSNDFENSDFNQIRQQLLKSNYNKRTSNQFISNLAQSKYPISAKSPENMYEKFSDEDYEELMEKLKVADLVYTEYSLEDIIYQLAKVMFAQSLSHGNSEAQDALQKFTSFLENEVELGRISRSLETKVIGVLIASLTDTLNEHPEYMSAARGENVVQSKLVPYNVLPQNPLSTNSEDDFRRSMFKPAMKKRNIQSSGILDGISSKQKMKNGRK